MNKLNKVIAFSLLSICISSDFVACTAIEEYSDGSFSFDEIFKNAKKTGGYMNTCYSHLLSGGNCYGNSFLASFSDEAQDANDVVDGVANQWSMGRASAYSNPIGTGFWSQCYLGIRNCNILLANIDSASVTYESDRRSYKAQAHALRAYYYLQIIKRYGGAPIVTQQLPLDYDYSKIGRSSFSECARQIFSDCDSALAADNADLMWFSGTSTSFRSRMSKAIASAIKSQTALYAASPLWNDGTITWKDAAEISRTALDSCLANGYELYNKTPTATAGYTPLDVYFYTQSDVVGIVDKETIMELTSQMTPWKYCGLPTTLGQSSAGTCPSQELVDAFETISGKMPVLGYQDADHLIPNLNPEATDYNESNPYANRDPRLKAFIYYNGALLNLSTKTIVNTSEGANCALSATSVQNTRTGYYIRKYTHYESNRTSNKDGYFKVFRLAELYLNYAEAANEASTTGFVPDAAVDAVNAIRSRVGMPALSKGMTCTDFRVRVHNERRVELAFEEHRFFDVRRWHILNETDKVVTGLKAIDAGNGSFTYQRFVVDNTRKVYEDKYLLFPIPGDEAIRMKNWTGVDCQNPGW